MVRKIAKRILARTLPREMFVTLKNYKKLSVDFGQYKTMRRWDSVDAEDAPVPWYTYPAIEYLRQLDFSDKTVFEYGSGNSTLFWSECCKKLVSVEDDRKWYDKIRRKVASDKVKYHLFEESQEYIRSIRSCPDDFDIIIIDGNYRYDCAVESLGKLKHDGFIILDNSDWEENTSKLLRESDLIEIDMAGFGPINGYTWTTSFYLRRNVKLTPAYDRQPISGIGSLRRRYQ